MLVKWEAKPQPRAWSTRPVRAPPAVIDGSVSPTFEDERFSVSDFLAYWKNSTVLDVLESDDPLLDYAGSNQFGRVQNGDTVWFTTVWPGGQMVLLGRIRAAVRANQNEAEQLLAGRDLWEATEYIISGVDTAEPLREVDIGDIAADLRFESKIDRLQTVAGRVNANQLQSMRRLDNASAALLLGRWTEDASIERAISDLRSKGSGFGTAEMNVQVERAAVNAVTRQYQAAGWRVASVESQKIGYDLLCESGEEREHVEVKGTRGNVGSFIITEGERQRADQDSQFRLCLVMKALEVEPAIQTYDSTQLNELFHFIPLAYRAIPQSITA
jgi:hypothetical protein